MIISRRQNQIHLRIKEPTVRVERAYGKIAINKTGVDLLEIDDEKSEGVVFGYNNGSVYISHSSEAQAFRGNYKQGERTLRISSRHESRKIVEYLKSGDTAMIFKISNESQDIVISEKYKFHKLIRL